MSAAYEASPIKRSRATREEVLGRRQHLYDIVSEMKPMTVRQVYYQATVRNVIEKTEAGYGKIQTDLVQMRRAGSLPYDWLADNTRWQRRPRTELRSAGTFGNQFWRTVPTIIAHSPICKPNTCR